MTKRRFLFIIFAGKLKGTLRYWREGIDLSDQKPQGDSVENILRKFKRQCAKSGILGEIRKREHYEKPSVKRKKKSEAARKRKFKNG